MNIRYQFVYKEGVPYIGIVLPCTCYWYIAVTSTRECLYSHMRELPLPLVSGTTRTREFDVSLSSTSCCYFNTSFMRLIFGRCHTHFIYYSTPCYYFNTSFMRSINFSRYHAHYTNCSFVLLLQYQLRALDIQ